MGDSQVFRSWLHTWLQLLVVSWLQKKLKIRVLCYTCWGTHILYNIYTFTHSFMLEYDPFHIYEYKKVYIMSPLIFYGPFIFHLTWYITSILCALSCLSYFFAGFFCLLHSVSCCWRFVMELKMKMRKIKKSRKMKLMNLFILDPECQNRFWWRSEKKKGKEVC